MSDSEYPDSLKLNEDKSFKLNYNNSGHPLPEVLFGNWVQCGNSLYLIPENFVRKIVEEKDTTLNDSIAISVYDHNFDQFRFHTDFTCYTKGDTVEMSHTANKKNDFDYYFIIHCDLCDSIMVEADELLSGHDNFYRPIITPKPNTCFKVHSRFSGSGFFTARNFHFRKRGTEIQVRWHEELYDKWKREVDWKVYKGYKWLEKIE